MREIGIDVGTQKPKELSEEMVKNAGQNHQHGVYG
jgi:hypothetical protein